MNRTKVLVSIVILLSFSICFYLFYVKFDEIVDFLVEVIDDYTDKEIIIPNEVY